MTWKDWILKAAATITGKAVLHWSGEFTDMYVNDHALYFVVDQGTDRYFKLVELKNKPEALQ